MMEKSALAVEGGGCTPTPFHSSYHHVQSCSVRSSWKGRDTLPVFHLYPLRILWWGLWGGGGGREPILGCHTTTISPPYPPHTLYGGPVRRSEILEQWWPYACLQRYACCIRDLHISISVYLSQESQICLYAQCMYCTYTSFIASSCMVHIPVPYTYTVCITSSAVKLCNNRRRAMTSDLIHILIYLREYTAKHVLLCITEVQ